MCDLICSAFFLHIRKCLFIIFDCPETAGDPAYDDAKATRSCLTMSYYKCLDGHLVIYWSKLKCSYRLKVKCICKERCSAICQKTLNEIFEGLKKLIEFVEQSRDASMRINLRHIYNLLT